MEILFIICVSVLQVSAQLMESKPSYKVNDFRNQSGNFSWKNCDGQDLPLSFSNMNMLPDPLNVSVSNAIILILLDYNLTKTLGADGKLLELDLGLRLKTPSGYVDVCNLIKDDRLCHYNDVCESLSEYTSICEKYIGEGCSCPFKPAEGKKLPLLIPIKHPLPFLVKGTFESTISIKHAAKTVGCLEVDFCVTKCMF